jgi:hypothetical protein
MNIMTSGARRCRLLLIRSVHELRGPTWWAVDLLSFFRHSFHIPGRTLVSRNNFVELWFVSTADLSIQRRSTERHSTQRQQYSAASTERHINSALLRKLIINSAPHQLSAVFCFHADCASFGPLLKQCWSQTTDMNTGEANCLALQTPTFDFWLEITWSTENFNSWIHPNYILILSSYFSASQNGTSRQTYGWCLRNFRIPFTNMYLLAKSKSYYVNSNRFLVSSKDLYLIQVLQGHNSNLFWHTFVSVVCALGTQRFPCIDISHSRFNPWTPRTYSRNAPAPLLLTRQKKKKKFDSVYDVPASTRRLHAPPLPTPRLSACKPAWHHEDDRPPVQASERNADNQWTTCKRTKR